jgi:hypothetical protein
LSPKAAGNVSPGTITVNQIPLGLYSQNLVRLEGLGNFKKFDDLIGT